jgi:hypothetical protein
MYLFSGDRQTSFHVKEVSSRQNAFCLISAVQIKSSKFPLN